MASLLWQYFHLGGHPISPRAQPTTAISSAIAAAVAFGCSVFLYSPPQPMYAFIIMTALGSIYASVAYICSYDYTTYAKVSYLFVLSNLFLLPWLLLVFIWRHPIDTPWLCADLNVYVAYTISVLALNVCFFQRIPQWAIITQMCVFLYLALDSIIARSPFDYPAAVACCILGISFVGLGQVGTLGSIQRLDIFFYSMVFFNPLFTWSTFRRLN